MPNPFPAPEPPRHPPPRGLQRAVLTLLSIAPMIDLLAIVTGNPPLTTLAARAAQLVLLAAIGPALALIALTA
jgi:hypothetical protein